jgi:hypothetical protein
MTTFLPADGERIISASLQRAIEDVLSEIPAEKSGAFVTAVTVDGVGRASITAAVGYRVAETWTVATWLRTDVRDALDAGVWVKKTW